MAILDEIQQKEARLKELEEQKNELISHDEIDQNEVNRITDEMNVLSNRLNELYAARGEQEQREQKQAEHIDGLMDAVVDLKLFEAVADKQEGEHIHEYENRRKLFYEILHDFVKEQQQSLINVHNAELAQKDEKIRTLTAQVMNTENQLAEEKKMSDFLEAQVIHLSVDIDNAKAERDTARELSLSAQDQNVELMRKAVELQSTISELQSKLEQANKPKDHTPPSESIQKRVESLKKFNVDELMARFQERQSNGGKVKIDLPSIGEPQGDSFRTEDHPTDNGTTDGVLSEESVDFRDEVQTSEPGLAQENTGDSESAMGTLEEAFERIKTLEVDMEVLKRRNGMVA